MKTAYTDIDDKIKQCMGGAGLQGENGSACTPAPAFNFPQFRNFIYFRASEGLTRYLCPMLPHLFIVKS